MPRGAFFEVNRKEVMGREVKRGQTAHVDWTAANPVGWKKKNGDGGGSTWTESGGGGGSTWTEGGGGGGKKETWAVRAAARGHTRLFS